MFHVPFNESVVSIAHRLPDYKENGIPNIIVKFVTRYAKNAWINAARSSTNLTANDLNTSWQKTNIFVNDHLTPTNKRLLGRLRGPLKDKKIVGAWSRDCKVMMRVKTDGSLYPIKDVQDIENAL